jgi:hypothetical protein
MNENTEKLLRDLAEKFGTTAEHLWGVLIKQAPISAASQLFVMAITGAAAAFLCVVTKRLGAKAAAEDSSDIGYFISTTLAAIAAIIFTIAFFAGLDGLPLAISGFFNPEYWALKQIIK